MSTWLVTVGYVSVPVSRIEFAADRASKYVSEFATGQSESQRARDQPHSAIVNPRVNLRFCSYLASPDI